MLNIIKFAIITAVILSINFTQTFAKGVQTDIKGKFFEKGGKTPLPYATITVLTSNNKVVTGATSGNHGEFAFRSLVDGSTNQ